MTLHSPTHKVWGLALLICWSCSAFANHYQARVDVAEWVVESSPFVCRLKHPVPYYGEGVFEQQAGEKLAFYLSSRAEYMAAGEARVQSLPPLWQPERHEKDLGTVPVKQSHKPLVTNEALAMSLLDELRRGMVLNFQRQSWYQKQEGIAVDISPVQFQTAYRAYVDCLAQLLPENFQQLERSTLLFASGKYELQASAQQKLNHIVAYLKADPTVVAMLLDGHTDSMGDRESNLLLAKQRAEVAARYLIASGVDAGRITTRFHGERYPIASNGSANGRQKNRRVTIKLEKNDLVSAEEAIPPQASVESVP